MGPPKRTAQIPRETEEELQPGSCSQSPPIFSTSRGHHVRARVSCDSVMGFVVVRLLMRDLFISVFWSAYCGLWLIAIYFSLGRFTYRGTEKVLPL